MNHLLHVIKPVYPAAALPNLPVTVASLFSISNLNMPTGCYQDRENQGVISQDFFNVFFKQIAYDGGRQEDREDGKKGQN